MQYTVIFHSGKNDNFQIKIVYMDNVSDFSKTILSQFLALTHLIVNLRSVLSINKRFPESLNCYRTKYYAAYYGQYVTLIWVTQKHAL